MRRRVALRLAVGVGLAWAAPLARADDGTALRDLVERVYAAQAAHDFEAAVAAWDPASADLPARRSALRRLFATYDRIEVRDLRIAEVAIDGDTARVRADVDLEVLEPVSGEVAAGFGPMRRVLECARRADGWRVTRESAAEEALARSILAAADDEARWALLGADPSASRLELFRAIGSAAEAHQLQGRVADAFAALETARRLADRLGDPLSQARVLNSLASHHLLKGDAGDALLHLERALSLAEDSDDVELVATLLVKIGNARNRLGDPQGATRSYEASSALREAAGHHAANVPTLGNLGNQAALAGDYERAAAIHLGVLAEAEALEDEPTVGNTLNTLGAIEHERGNYRGAGAYYARSLARAEAAGRKREQALALNNIGLAQRLQGNLDVARDNLARSLALRETLGDKAGTASTLLNLGMVERIDGNGEAARAFYERSLALREGMGDTVGMAIALNSLGLLQESEGRLDEALGSYRRSLEIAERVGLPPRIAQALVNVAQVHGARGEDAVSLATAARAATVARQIGSQESLCNALTASGRALRRMGRPEEAQRDLEEAASVLESMRDDAGATLEERQRFLESRVAPYEELAALAVDRGDARAALAMSERAKARALLDILQGGRARVGSALSDDERERERALRSALEAANVRVRREQGRSAPDAARLRALEDERRQARAAHEAFETRLYAAHPDLRARRGRPDPFADTDAAVVLSEPDAAAAAFLVTRDRTYLFVLTRETSGPRLAVHTLPAGREDLARRVEAFRDGIARRDLEVRRAGRALFDLLLGPAQAQIAGRTRLVIVPDGPLWELPFQALATPRGRFLLEDVTLSYAPSLTVLREMRRAADGLTRAPRALLALGDPRAGRGAGKRAGVMAGNTDGALPDAEAQVRTLARLYGPTASAVYWGPDASERLVKEGARDFRILHFATHGVLDDRRPLYSYVALAPTDDGTEDGLLEARELLEMDLRADLVVLSACETGRGRFAPGEGLVGMAWAAFAAGSPSTVASLWRVDAASTRTLMERFHRGLTRAPGPRLPTAAALREAALATMRDSRYRHPFYWAGFVMIGDPN